MSNHQPIGVFDSGVGGLSVLEHIHRQLPAENLIYLADSAYIPYGSLQSDLIQRRSHLIAEFFISRGVKAMVVACNTATAAAIESLRLSFQIPVIGMEPAVKPAVLATQVGVIGVLATSGTLASEKFSSLVKRFGSSAEVVFQPGDGLVEQVESGNMESEETHSLLKKHLEPLMKQGVDTLVLGCTHYPFLIPQIREIVGDDVVILDTGDAIASELKRQLEAAELIVPKLMALDLTTPESSEGSVTFFSSGDAEAGRVMISRLWGRDVTVEYFPEEER
ncbi:MAG: glutamate racemase [Mariprofundaceae bacterium]